MKRRAPEYGEPMIVGLIHDDVLARLLPVER